MIPAPIPDNEKERLEALYDYQILDTQAEPCFDELTLLATYICKTPIALISLLDRDRQWFKSIIGPIPPEISRDSAFCSHCILQQDLMIISDTLKDERFIDHPLVISEPKIRFYGGFPLINDQGFALGSLCVMDVMPRNLAQSQTESLKLINYQIIRQLNTRRHLSRVSQAIDYCFKSLTTS
jgi:GAF domain-containing protein